MGYVLGAIGINRKFSPEGTIGNKWKFSPEGTAEHSQGRQPLGEINPFHLSREAATEIGSSEQFLARLQGDLQNSL
ncbi:MAG: hypothetical protein ABSE63_18185 [Thermoguttaceae bacterium]|jgi:hypothetical protein